MSFGVIIICSDKDFGLAKGCLASVKYFMPDIETCLLIDGDVNADDVKKVYGSTILRKKDIKNEFLREKSFGWSITKMIALWESPFENFLLLDADICVWGNIIEDVDWRNFDIVVDKPNYLYDEEAINTWFFDVKKLREIDDKFSPNVFSGRYNCPGVYFFKRGSFELNWYKELSKLNEVNPGLFKFGDMGMFNYMVFKSVSENKLKVNNHQIQHICPDYSKKESRKMFSFKNGVPQVETKRAIHYNGDWKPYLKNEISYHEPMTYFRTLFYKKLNPDMSDKKIKNILLEEDKAYEKKKSTIQKIKAIVRPIAKPVYLRIKKLMS